MKKYTDAVESSLKIHEQNFDGVSGFIKDNMDHLPFDDASLVPKLIVCFDATKPPDISYSFLKKEIDILKEQVSKFKEVPQVVTAKMYSLTSNEYELTNTIDIILKIFPNEVLALIPDLEIYGEGATEPEAINDLKMELIDLYEDLVDITDEKLGKFPKTWKKIVKTFIIKK